MDHLEEAIYHLVTEGCAVEFIKADRLTIRAIVHIPEVSAAYSGQSKNPYDALTKALVFSLNKVRRCHLPQGQEEQGAECDT